MGFWLVSRRLRRPPARHLGNGEMWSVESLQSSSASEHHHTILHTLLTTFERQVFGSLSLMRGFLQGFHIIIVLMYACGKSK